MEQTDPATTPEPATAQIVSEQHAGPKWFSWQWFKRQLSWLGRTLWWLGRTLWSKNTFYVVLAAVILLLVCRTIRQDVGLKLDPIALPESLSEAGFTTESAPQRLLEGIKAAQDVANDVSPGSDSGPVGFTDTDLLEVSIPDIGLSTQTVNAMVYFLFPAWRHEISGEFTQTGNALSLNLRLNQEQIFDDAVSLRGPADAPKAADELIGSDVHSSTFTKGAVFAILTQTQPYIALAALAASANNLSDADLAEASNLATNIIREHPDGDKTALWALNLRGMIEYHNKDYCDAKNDFQIAKKLPEAFANLAYLYNDDGFEKADLNCKTGGPAYYQQKGLQIYEYLTKNYPNLEATYIYLGNYYYAYQKNDFNLAITQYKTAIQIKPSDFRPHVHLGVIYSDQQDFGNAIAQFQTAAILNPTWAYAHYLIGYEYVQKFSNDSTKNDPQRSQWLQNACQAFNDGDKLAPTDARYRAGMIEVTKLMHGQGHCAPQ